MLVLRHGENNFGDHRSIHIWLSRPEARDANLMVILAYIIVGHPTWDGAEMSVFAALPSDQLDEGHEELRQMIHDGRIPVSEKNLQVLRISSQDALLRTVERTSSDADLVMTDLDLRASLDGVAEALQRCQDVPDMLFVAARERILIE